MYQYAEVVHWMNSVNTAILPASVDIDMTNHCNQDCYYCESSDFRQAQPTAQGLDQYLTLIQRLATWRAHTPRSTGSLHSICFSGGGEPTLYKGYEQVIESAIDAGFLTSMITNGTNLSPLINRVSVEKLQRMAWIGVDIDAGNQHTYEQIRRTQGHSIFDRVQRSVSALVACGVRVDLKILVSEYNSTESELRDIFALAQRLRVRSVYFRPTVINGVPFDYRPQWELIEKLSNEYAVVIKNTFKKFEPRTYNRCHQMYQFVIFCADGKMYTCCENKGQDRFAIGSWIEGDFRDLWLGQQHHAIYQGVNTQLCPPCRSHHHNLAIQRIIDDPEQLETLIY